MLNKDFQGISVVIVVFYGILTNLLNSGIRTITVLIPIAAAVLLFPTWELAHVICSHKLTIFVAVYVVNILFFRASAPFMSSSKPENGV